MSSIYLEDNNDIDPQEFQEALLFNIVTSIIDNLLI